MEKDLLPSAVVLKEKLRERERTLANGMTRWGGLDPPGALLHRSRSHRSTGSAEERGRGGNAAKPYLSC